LNNPKEQAMGRDIVGREPTSMAEVDAEVLESFYRRVSRFPMPLFEDYEQVI
jgi:hypothetical protein